MTKRELEKALKKGCKLAMVAGREIQLIHPPAVPAGERWAENIMLASKQAQELAYNAFWKQVQGQ